VAQGDLVSWGAELVKIRRYLRDPDGNIWSEAFLRHLYNDVQHDFQHKTNVLEGVATHRVPQTYHWSYLQEWEYRYCPTTESQYYQALSIHDDYVICHRWEAQQITGIAADVADLGVHFTQAWEAYTSETPGELVRMRFPANLNTMRFIAYDEEPIEASTKKAVQSNDPSYVTKEGEPICYFQVDAADNSYVLYPRPSSSFDNEASGEAIAQYADDDTENVTTGIIATRSGAFDDGEGVPVDIVDVNNSVFMVFTVSPTEMTTVSDEPDFPDFLRKYVRFGVISRAYGGNNDGRIRSLSDYWAQRYALGVQFAKRYNRNKKNDRDYRLTTKGAMSRRSHRHPRLPDGYPAI
jgi:hypothetical protein